MKIFRYDSIKDSDVVFLGLQTQKKKKRMLDFRIKTSENEVN
jgi:hypothetical protein